MGYSYATATIRQAALAVVVALLFAPGCGGSDSPRDASGSSGSREKPDLVPARCPESAGNCRAATGRVLFIESVDPDGDGDLHVVLLGGSLSAPGVTVLDVAPALRPARDPSPGDLVTGAGPVFRGSYGQRQIQVNTFRMAP